MTTAKRVSVERDAAGNPTGPRVTPLKSYSLRKLRKGEKKDPNQPEQTSFDENSPAAKKFVENLFDIPPTPPTPGDNLGEVTFKRLPGPTLLEDFATDVMPVISRSVVGMRVHASAMKTVMKNTFQFTRSSAVAIGNAVRVFVQKVAVERL